MRRPHRPWLLYALGLLLGLGAMGWVTLRTLRAERAEEASRARTAQLERERLAQWRMDSTMALFLGPESARPWSDFEAFHPAEGVVAGPAPARGREILVPSPLLLAEDALVRLRFQMDASGRFTAPLAPAPSQQALLDTLAVPRERLVEAKRRLDEVEARFDWASLRRAMAGQGAALLGLDEMKGLQGRTEGRGLGRTRLASPFQVFQGAWTPFWRDGELYLARQIWVRDRERIQVCWLDWPVVKEVLLSTVRDFLPGAELVPVRAGDGAEAAGRLSSLPVRLVGAGSPAAAFRAPLSARLPLATGWALALLGALAGGVVLVRSTLQAERRSAFASAVAHELRTPLTTFRLYTDLLAKGMVADPAEQGELHRTLALEAERLDHLVKNVLAFARLEAGREASREEVGAAELLERIRPRLEERAGQAGLVLAWEGGAALRDRRLHTDPLMVEQILFNLVDNACKYGGGSPGGIRISAEAPEGGLLVRVEDAGLGIPAPDQARLFRPFEKLGPREARRAPGVGLGLALSRRLARILGGDLAFEPGHPGACFVLSLPAKA